MDRSDNPTATHPHSYETTSSACYELRTSHISCPSDHVMIRVSVYCAERCNNSHPCSSLLCYCVSYEPCDWIPSCASISPVYQQKGQPGKSKCSLLSLLQEAAAKQNAKQRKWHSCLALCRESGDK